MKKTISISYDLRAPGKDYHSLHEAIKKVGINWAHPLESFWIVVTTQTCAQVRDSLAKHIDQNDQLLVADFGPNWASQKLLKEVSDWLKSYVS